MITKVVVAAAGQGVRMKELSCDKSKHLIEVEKKPFLAHLLDNVVEAGYKEIFLVVGFKENLMKQFVEDYMAKKPGDYKIKIISQFEILGPKDVAYGTACPIKCAKEFIGNENFISIAGDNFYSVRDLKMMGELSDDVNYVAGIFNETPERFGVLVGKSLSTVQDSNDTDFLEKIVEKPSEFVGNLINISFYKFTPEIFEKVNIIEKSSRGEYEITDAVSLLAREKKVKIKKINDFWMDFGRPEDVEKMKEILSKNK